MVDISVTLLEKTDSLFPNIYLFVCFILKERKDRKLDGWMGVWEELRDSKECDKNILYKILNKNFLKRLKVKKKDSKRERLQTRDFWENSRLQ